MVQRDDQDAGHEHPGAGHQEVSAGHVEGRSLLPADQALPQQVQRERHMQVSQGFKRETMYQLKLQIETLVLC